MSCNCYLVFKEKKAVYRSLWLSQPAKIGLKNRCFEEQIHRVPLKVARFFLREGGRLYTGYPERSVVLLPQLVLISAMCESFRPFFIRVFSWPCHVVLLVASLKNVPALLIFLGVNKLKHYIFIYSKTIRLRSGCPFWPSFSARESVYLLCHSPIHRFIRIS